jgi:predicted dehydrogenase
MAENTCFSPNNLIIQKMVREGLFGEIYFAEGEYVHEIKSLHYDADGSPTWRSKWQVGVNGCTYATHSLGPVLEWFGERVDSVVCLGSGRHTAPEHEMEDTTTMLCKTTSGALIKIRVDMLSNRPHGGGYFALQGTKGCFEAARGLGDKPKIWLEDFGKASANRETIDADPYEWRPLDDYREKFLPDIWKDAPPEAFASGHGGTDFFVVSDIIEAIREEKEPAIDVNRALDFTLPGLLSQKSISEGGRPIRVPDFRAGEWQ